jgi:hypothetical protein
MLKGPRHSSAACTPRNTYNLYTKIYIFVSSIVLMGEKTLLRNLKRTSLVLAASGLLGLNQMFGCYNLPQERCSSSGYFEGIISGGGGLFELYNAIAVDQTCGAVIDGLEALASSGG